MMMIHLYLRRRGLRSFRYNTIMSIYKTILKPTLLLDENTARANIQRMARKALSAGVQFRPHFKTHQSITIGSWFAEEGIDLEVILGQGSNFSVQSVDTGKAVFGIADAPVAITARAKGAKVKIIGIIFDKHPNCMYYWKDSGIKEPKDLVGKKVGVPAADGHKIMFPAFAKIIGIDPSKVEFINIEPAAKPAVAVALLRTRIISGSRPYLR